MTARMASWSAAHVRPQLQLGYMSTPSSKRWIASCGAALKQFQQVVVQFGCETERRTRWPAPKLPGAIMRNAGATIQSDLSYDEWGAGSSVSAISPADWAAQNDRFAGNRTQCSIWLRAAANGHFCPGISHLHRQCGASSLTGATAACLPP